MSRLTLGTHNLLDGAAPATAFAQLLFFTEAGGADYSRLTQAGGYEIHVCEEQPDLVVAVDRTLELDLEPHYKRAHWGARKVTPNRGTFWLTDDVAMVALVDEHRINAAFPPYVRGEGLFRRLAWEIHTHMTLRIIKRLIKQGYIVYAGGDLNTPADVAGYKKVLVEVGDGFDRLGSTEPFRRSLELSKFGSDHHRLKGWIG